MSDAPQAATLPPDAEARVRATTTRALEAIARAGHLAEWSQDVAARARSTLDDRDGLRGELAAARSALCEAVAGLAARLRRDGVPPERMLVLVKAAVREGAPAGADPAGTAELVSDAVRCGVRAYYAAA